jgi:hypothetical protein
LWGDTLYEAMLDGKKVCMCSLHDPLGEPAKSLLSILHVLKATNINMCFDLLMENAFSNLSNLCFSSTVGQKHNNIDA